MDGGMDGVSRPSRWRRLLIVLLSIVALVAGLVVLADLVCARPDWLAEYPCHRGWPSLGVFIGIVLVLPVTLATGLIRFAAPLVAIASVAGFTIVAYLPSQFTEEEGGSSLIAQIGIGATVLFFVLKMLLFVRQGEKATVRPTAPPGKLLPGQQLILERLRGRILADVTNGHVAPGRVIQLEGAWGTGKTYILRRLEADLDQRPDCAVIHLDVWKHDTELELHRAIVGDLLAHRIFLLPYRWLRQPVSLLAPMPIRELSLELTSKAGKVSLPVRNIRLPLQRRLESFVSMVARRRGRIIIVVDETDRASAETAQAMMTLLKRSLDMPGVTVVLAYVEAILRHKAFNPMTVRLPDLADNVDAHLLEVLSVAELPDLKLAEAVRAAPHNGDGQNGASPVRRELIAAFAALPASRRQIIQLGLAEKYLVSEPLVMGATRRKDILAVPEVFVSISSRLADITSVECSRYAAAMDDALAALESDHSWAIPALRHFEGALVRLASFLDRDESTAPFDEKQLAVVFAIAMRMATLYGARAAAVAAAATTTATATATAEEPDP